MIGRKRGTWSILESERLIPAWRLFLRAELPCLSQVKAAHHAQNIEMFKDHKGSRCSSLQRVDQRQPCKHIPSRQGKAVTYICNILQPLLVLTTLRGSTIRILYFASREYQIDGHARASIVQIFFPNSRAMSDPYDVKPGKQGI